MRLSNLRCSWHITTISRSAEPVPSVPTLLDNPGALSNVVHTSGAKSTDLQSPEGRRQLSGKCRDAAVAWAPAADRPSGSKHLRIPQTKNNINNIKKTAAFKLLFFVLHLFFFVYFLPLHRIFFASVSDTISYLENSVVKYPRPRVTCLRTVEKSVISASGTSGGYLLHTRSVFGSIHSEHFSMTFGYISHYIAGIVIRHYGFSVMIGSSRTGDA